MGGVGDKVEVVGTHIEITQDLSETHPDFDWSNFEVDVVNMTLPIVFGVGFVLLMVFMAFLSGNHNGFRMLAVGLVAGGTALGVAGAGVYNSAVSESILVGDGV